VVRLYDHWLDRHRRLHLVMDWAAHGDLLGYMRKLQGGGLWDKSTAVKLMAQVARGLAHVHGRRILHRDIKLENVLVAGGGRAVLADFGLAKVGGSSLQGTLAGTPFYMAPEVNNEDRYSAPADVWSLGVAFWFMACGKEDWASWPFADDPSRAPRGIGRVARLINSQSPNWDILPAAYHDELRPLLEAMLRKAPRERPTAAAVAAHPLFARVPEERVAGGAGAPAATGAAMAGAGSAVAAMADPEFDWDDGEPAVPANPAGGAGASATGSGWGSGAATGTSAGIWGSAGGVAM
jgi:serine/threonine protein kinase